MLLVEVLGIIGGTVLGLSYLLPVLLFRYVRIPSKRVVRSISEEWVNATARPQMMEVAAQLEALGFRVADVLFAQDPHSEETNGPSGTSVEFAVLLSAPEPTTVGYVAAMCPARDAPPSFLFCELHSHLDDGTQLITKNSTALQGHHRLGNMHTWVVPEAARCDVLLRLHRLRLEMLGGTRRELRLDDPVAYHLATWTDELAAKKTEGLMLAPEGGFVAHTWKGAAWMALSTRWPFKAFFERRRLAEVGPLLEKARAAIATAA